MISRRKLAFAALLVLLLPFAACVRRVPEPGLTGMASWYGKDFHGRKTASGERFDMYAMTASHPSLPFGTRVRVTNLENNLSVTVRINDRGRLKAHRIIDVSYAAAKKLRFLEQGTVRVALEILD